ncbi:hypothetical protein DER45DRAFT_567738 [Fusarium avenaceum]|nr:hypothetical protein DER45DRAFT_567738 [Fusarium avenaceum]
MVVWYRQTGAALSMACISRSARGTVRSCTPAGAKHAVYTDLSHRYKLVSSPTSTPCQNSTSHLLVTSNISG